MRWDAASRVNRLRISGRNSGHPLNWQKDVARVEMGSQSYNSSFHLGKESGAALGVFQLPDANGFTIAKSVRTELDSLSRFFPQDIVYEIPYDTTRFVEASIHEVIEALFLAMALVFLVVYVFLQDLRGTLIPGAAIPVSLIGTFAFMAPSDSPSTF